LMDFRNDSRTPQRKLRFISSDFARVQRISGPSGQPLPFRTKHQEKIFAYVVPLKAELLPGRTVFLEYEGYSTNLIRQLDTGEFECFMQHWPATGATTLCVQTYRLPTGAQVLETTPPDMIRRQLQDGRLELRTQKIIPPDGNITVRIRFRQPQP